MNTIYKSDRGIFCVEDASNKFLDDRSVDLFIVNPPFFGAHAAEYGNFSYQMHNVPSLEDYLIRVAHMVSLMQDALTDNGTVLLVLPNLPFIFEFIEKLDVDLKFGQLIVWDLMREGNGVNHSALIFALHKGQPTRQDNSIVRIPAALDEDLDTFKPVGFVDDSLPIRFYEHMIERFSTKGDTVSDIMGGTGAICIAAKNLDRKFIYNDVSEEQARVAVARYTKFNGLE